MHVPLVASTSTAGDDAIEVIEARISETSGTMLRLALSLVWDVSALRCHYDGSEGNYSVPCPSVEHHTEYQPMRQTPVRQPSAEEIEPQDSLAPTPHSPIEMEPSPASLPPEVTIEEPREYDGVGGSGNQALKPSSMKRFKRTSKRIVKRPPACKSRLSPNVLNNSLKYPMQIG
ncbi:hypothetical protein PVL29_017100 [Vitis rotundifolia]|uniref:Uncharacterized protein n=1 Tax=Vitis rotundifolia TaxID=103349 RepID=A0AA38Z9K0_VITRO|nr:hypothetical protein PVL29_017100 [Vitis rotundifolia]